MDGNKFFGVRYKFPLSMSLSVSLLCMDSLMGVKLVVGCGRIDCGIGGVGVGRGGI